MPRRFGARSVTRYPGTMPDDPAAPSVPARSTSRCRRHSTLPARARSSASAGPCAGDKVMQTENDYDKEVYNGDVGYVEDVDPEAGELSASFDGRIVVYGFGELDALVPAYAATVHKSQGSEYPAVVIPVLTQPLRHAAVQPAVHRRDARQASVVLVGQKKAVAIAVCNVSGRRRWSGLAVPGSTPIHVHATGAPAGEKSRPCQSHCRRTEHHQGQSRGRRRRYSGRSETGPVRRRNRSSSGASEPSRCATNASGWGAIPRRAKKPTSRPDGWYGSRPGSISRMRSTTMVSLKTAGYGRQFL